MNDWLHRPQHTDRAITDYFQSVYPQRESPLARIAFRRGEQARLHDISQWLPSVVGRSLLDAGCGDARFLDALLARGLAGRPQVIRLEDLIVANVRAATARMSGRAEVVDGDVYDSCSAVGPAVHDIVLAIGILDYWPDWPQRLAHLISRSRGVAIVTLPVPSGLHYRARRVWLARHGIALQRVTEHDLQTALVGTGLPYHVHRTRYEWVVLIDASANQPASPASSALPQPRACNSVHA
jgi:SAM-dependent methyltransferase